MDFVLEPELSRGAFLRAFVGVFGSGLISQRWAGKKRAETGATSIRR
jgi:hypothetical protein